MGVNIPFSIVTEQLRYSLFLWGAAGVLAIAIALVSGPIDLTPRAFAPIHSLYGSINPIRIAARVRSAALWRCSF